MRAYILNGTLQLQGDTTREHDALVTICRALNRAGVKGEMTNQEFESGEWEKQQAQAEKEEKRERRELRKKKHYVGR